MLLSKREKVFVLVISWSMIWESSVSSTLEERISLPWLLPITTCHHKLSKPMTISRAKVIQITWVFKVEKGLHHPKLCATDHLAASCLSRKHMAPSKVWMQARASYQVTSTPRPSQDTPITSQRIIWVASTRQISLSLQCPTLKRPLGNCIQFLMSSKREWYQRRRDSAAVIIMHVAVLATRVTVLWHWTMLKTKTLTTSFSSICLQTGLGSVNR